ncbi:hypothetical protein BDY24DRAFT_392878 [Mrakia frigida]|uniref:uncharacterized protein n=1 Tax=Mrakia frigida TaxID=29902 RepID=UPI003FCC0EE6
MASTSSAFNFGRKPRTSVHLRPGEGPDFEEDEMVDPELRLRTVRTAASTIALSIHNEDRSNRTRKFLGLGRRDRDHKKATKSKRSTTPAEAVDEMGAAEEERTKSKSTEVEGKRRNIYVNWPLPLQEVTNGDPIVRYVRNKVRTSKYTILTFLPKNILMEQFRRVANMYFLLLVILQIFPVFGATTPQIAMLPLLAILAITAFKDGIEDYRRASLDDQVNNSAATKLGDWRNVNQPHDPRTFFERLIGAKNPNEKISKGVRKLREKEAREGKEIVLVKAVKEDDEEVMEEHPDRIRGRAGNDTGAGESYAMDDIQSINSDHEYMDEPSGPRLGGSHPDLAYLGGRGRSNTVNSLHSSMAPSKAPSSRSGGVVDWDRTSPGTAKWERTLWKKLEVGDVVLLRDDEQVPADIVILSTSDADGICYVETKNLDGETNLKVRKALKATSNINSEEDLEHAKFMMDVEPPHANLYTFNGLLKYSSREVDSAAPSGMGAGPSTSGLSMTKSNSNTSFGSAWKEKLEPVTINELLLRGCTIRNSQWIIGLVVFTGGDTKIMLNGGETPSKRSKIEVETNFNVIMNFIILMGLCIVTAVIYGFVQMKDGRSFNSFEVGSNPSDNTVINALVIFVSGLIVFQNIVPISLYISIEIVKTIQAFFIFQDIEMYYAPLDTPCVPKTWDISDDLGQIEYIFSDKTGTLTQNVMEFKKVSVNGIIYGEGVTEAMVGAAKREGREVIDFDEQAVTLRRSLNVMIERMKKGWKNRYLQEDKLTLVAPDLVSHLADRSSPHRSAIMELFRALAICHGVIADKPFEDKPHHIDYKAESPDEAALVAAARDAGFPFIHKNNHHLDIEVLGQPERYVPLRVLEFNSTRKRMSVIVRSPEGRIVMYVKGADSVIYARLREDHDLELKTSTQRDLETMANAGLRTLCVAYRYLDETEYLNWSVAYEKAANSIRDRDEEIDKACEFIEHSLTILGATALEDKLQEGVPATIETLHQAGIKLWILTGDKVQTAIEIAFSCNLLTNDMDIFILSAETEEGARLQIEGGLNKIASVNGPPLVGSKKLEGTGHKTTGFAVVIDGDTLRFALDSGLKTLFLDLATQCETVVCCRVSPAQKAATVRLVKEGRNAMTLSIGDGANDVAMIQEAHIGVGLFGHEGSQAAMSADYAFGQFRFLTRLLLVHGHWSYVRVAEMHANFFYKNIIWTGTLFWFCIFNEWEATYLFEYTFILLYNLIFTSLPVIIMGAFDQDVNAAALLAFPQLYERGIKGLEYTRTKFWLYVIDGLYQSVICFFIPWLVYGEGQSGSYTGRDTDSLYELGTTIATGAIASANLFIGLNSRYWTFMTFLSIFLSIFACFLWIAVYSLFPTFFFDWELIILYSTMNFWATVVVVIVLAIGPHFLYRGVMGFFFPLDKDLVREAWVAGDLKQRLGIQSRKSKMHHDVEDRAVIQSLKSHHLQTASETSVDDSNSYDGQGQQPPPTAGQHSSNLDGDATPTQAYGFPPSTTAPASYHYNAPNRSANPLLPSSGPYSPYSEEPPQTASPHLSQYSSYASPSMIPSSDWKGNSANPDRSAAGQHVVDLSEASNQSWETAQDGNGAGAWAETDDRRREGGGRASPGYAM